jgi:hypothetical protein
VFVLGIGFIITGYALAYYGIDVLSWSRSAVADKTRPVPIRYLFGVPIPTAPPMEQFHPPFTLNDVDRANAVTALGGGTTGIAGTASADPAQMYPDGTPRLWPNGTPRAQSDPRPQSLPPGDPRNVFKAVPATTQVTA